MSQRSMPGIVFVLLVIGGFALLWRTNGNDARSARALGLAANAPADTQLFVAFDAGTAGGTMSLDKALQEMPAERAAQYRQQMDEAARIGVPMKMIMQWCQMAGFVEAFPRPGEKTLITNGQAAWPCDAVVALAAVDDKTARDSLAAYFDEHGELGARAATSRDGPSWTFDGGGHQWQVMVYHKWVLLGTGAAAIDHAVKTMSQSQPSLLTNPTFKTAVADVAADDSLLAFAAMRDMFAPLAAGDVIDNDYFDRYTAKALAGFDYLVASMRRPTSDGAAALHGFAKLDTQNSEGFIKALHQQQPVDPTLARFFPSEWHNFSAGNLKYLYGVAMQVAQLPPKARPAMLVAPFAIEKALGVSPEDLLAATSGDYGLAVDLNDFNFDRVERPHGALELHNLYGLLALKVTDRQKFESSLGKIEHHFHVWSQVRQGMHYYRRPVVCWTIQDKVFLLGLGPRAAQVVGQSLHQPHPIADDANFKATVPTDPKNAVGLSYADYTAAGQAAVAMSDSDIDHVQSKLRSMARAMHMFPYQVKWLHGTSVLRLEADGLHWEQRGALPSTAVTAFGTATLSGGLAIDAMMSQRARHPRQPIK